MGSQAALSAALGQILPEALRGEASRLAEELSGPSWVTPLEWNAALGCHLKREDRGPFETHKFRGLGLQIALARRGGPPGYVISSSGNAAVATGGWLNTLGLRGLAFLSDKTPVGKVEAVARTGITTVVTPKPKNFSRYAARYAGLVDLRPSRDRNGALGYRTLAVELVEQLGGPPSDCFLFINSGLTLLGAWEGFRRLRATGVIANLPRMHAVQNTHATALVEALGGDVRLEATPCAGALGAQVPADLEATARAIERSGGSLWMVANDEVATAVERLSQAGLSVALESAAALAGLRRALRSADIEGLGAAPVVVVAGPDRAGAALSEQSSRSVHRPASYTDVRELLEAVGLGRADVG